jgi:hypothetical protein
MAAPCRAQERQSVREEVRALAGIQEHLPRQGVERSDLDGGGVRDLRAEPPGHASSEVLRRVAVERHDADAIRTDPAREQNRESRHHRRRLSAARGRDDLRRSIGQRRRRALFGIQHCEDRFDVQPVVEGNGHAVMIVTATYQPIIGGLLESLLS